MSITKQLREYADKCDDQEYTRLYVLADRIDAAHEKAMSEQFKSLTIDMKPMTEENMAEGGWVRGPLDADGKIWRSGDMSDSNWGVIERIAYEDGKWYIKGHDTSAPWIPADSIHHYHEPTIEETLREFAQEMAENLGMYSGDAIDADEWQKADTKTIAKYADRIKDMTSNKA